jgi:NTE family protein
MRSGPLIPALTASAAIPGYFPPVRTDGRLLVDGGLVANADLEIVLEAHVRDVVLVDLQAPVAGEQLTGTRSILEQAVTISLARQTELERRRVDRRLRLAVVRLSPPERPRPWDFSHTDELFAMGREAGERLLTSHLVNGRVRPGVVEAARVLRPPAQTAPAAGTELP